MTKSTGSRKRWPKAVDDRIEALTRQGRAPAAIAEELSVPLHKVRKVQRARSLKYDAEARSRIAQAARAPSVPEYAADVTERILGLRAQGVARREIAARLDVTYDKVCSDIQRHLKQHPEQRLGVKLRQAQALGRQLDRKRVRAAAASRTEAERDRLDDEIVTARGAGQQLRQIAARFGISLHRVKSVCAERGVQVPATDYDAELRATASVRDVKVLESYAGSAVKIGFECAEGHYFRMSPNTFRAGHGCRVCYVASRTGVPNPSTSKYRWEDVLAACAKARFDFVGTVPADSHVVGAMNVDGRYALRCHCGETFRPSLHDVIYGKYASCGCVKSQAPFEIRDALASWGHDVVMNDRSVLAPLELDLYLPAARLAIEYNGLYWHGEVLNGAEARVKHVRKWQLAQAAGIRLIQVFEDEWVFGRDKVLSVLRSALGSNPRRLGARSLRLSLVAADHADAFLEAHHLYGPTAGTHAGLYDGEELLAMLTVRHPTASRVPAGYRKDETLEIARFCVAGGVTVAGAFSRLLALVGQRARALVTYSDNRWSEGALYEAAGFVRDGISAPTYAYARKGTQGPRRHRFGFRKKMLARLYPGATGTEWQIMRAAGWDRVWDCGTTRWVLKR